MKICVLAPSPRPFILGGAEKFFLGLVRAINRYTSHEAELLKIPVYEKNLIGLIDAYESFSNLDLSYFDMVITTKYPAWMVSHKNHHVYLQHKCRGLYDLYPFDENEPLPSHPWLDRIYSIMSEEPSRKLLNTFFSELRPLLHKLPPGLVNLPSPFARRVIRFLDDIGLHPHSVKSYSSISENVKNRKGYFPKGVEVKVIHHPTDLEGLHSLSYSYIFTASRLETLKRMDLLIKAYREVKSDIPFLIAGTGGEEGYLKDLARSDPRVRILGFVSDSELISHYSRAIFVPFVPYDEDYGLITLEAMLSEKPVLTTFDSGGPKELVRDKETGLIVSPTVDDLSEAIKYFLSDLDSVRLMGKKAKESVSHINWENTVRSLFDETRLFIPRPKRKLKILITTTFQVYPPVQGGQKRIFNLWKNLSKDFDITLLTIGYEERVSVISESLKEIVVPRSKAHLKTEEEILKIFGQSEGDISFIEGYRKNPEYLDKLREESRDAKFVVLSHPYLFYAVREVYSGPIIYEAHNCEYNLKLPILKEREDYLSLVKKVEEDCSRDSAFIISVSETDKKTLAKLYGVAQEKIVVIENGADFSLSRKLDGKEKKELKKRLGLSGYPCGVFIGSFHKPNVDSLYEIEKISERLPHLLFLVAGTVCKAKKGSVPKNLKLLGPIDEDEKGILFRASDFALNPVISGSGSNLKLLDYISSFLPVITTPFGMRGYKFTDEHLFISDIENFPEMIQKILDFPELDKMIDRAYVHAKALYDWKVLGERLLTTVKDFVKKI